MPLELDGLRIEDRQLTGLIFNADNDIFFCGRALDNEGKDICDRLAKFKIDSLVEVIAESDYIRREGVSSPVVALTIRDLRSQGILTPEQVCSGCVNQLGFKDICYFSFPIGLLDVDEKTRKLFLEQASNQFIETQMRQIGNIKKLGLTEAFRYLQNAQQRFYTRTPEGYSNCKTDCRNAIDSALSSLSGTSDVRKAVKILGKKGVIGRREEELITAFESLLAKMKGVLSKKGPHPPRATEEEDAELALNITQALLNYLAKRALRTT